MNRRPFTLIAVTSAAAGVAFFGATKAKDVEQAEVSSPAPQSASVEHPETAPPPAATGAPEEVDEGRGVLASVPAPSTTDHTIQSPDYTIETPPETTTTVAAGIGFEASGTIGPDRDFVLSCIRSHEQGAAGYATETGNGFSGAYQFIPSTWRYAVTLAGYPEWASWRASEAPPHVQDAAAWALYQEQGYGPWPPAMRYCR